jgi:hypothetical protein
VQQSVEFGGRVASVSGNQQLYDTLVNLKSGPPSSKLPSMTTELNSIRLHSAFGFGPLFTIGGRASFVGEALAALVPSGVVF